MRNKLDYKRYFRLDNGEQMLRVDVTTRVWLAYHDDDNDDWMNKVFLLHQRSFPRLPNRIGNLEASDRNEIIVIASK